MLVRRLSFIVTALAFADRTATTQIRTAFLCSIDAEQSCSFAGQGVIVKGTGIIGSGPIGGGSTGTLYLIDKVGGWGSTLGCDGQGWWGFDFRGKSRDAYFSGKTQQVNGKLSAFFSSDQSSGTTHGEIRSRSDGDDLSIFCTA